MLPVGMNDEDSDLQMEKDAKEGRMKIWIDEVWGERGQKEV